MDEIKFDVQDVETVGFGLDFAIEKIYPPLVDVTITPTKEQQILTHEGEYGYDNVTVDPIPDEYIIPEGTLPITENTTYDVRRYSRVSANVKPAPELQEKEITITENGTQNITYDEGYDGLSNVKVTTNAIEDLDEELNEYNSTLTTQEVTINDIAKALQNKMLGDNADKSITELYYDAYSNFYDNFNGDYNKKYDTNEEIILYTPVEGYTHYFILYTSGKKYSIAWTPDTRQIGNVSYQSYWKTYDFVPRATVGINSISFWTNGVKQQKLSSFSGFLNINTSNSGINYYVSSEYNTLEECINAIKSSDTTYTNRTTTTYAVLPYGETKTPVVATNSIEIGQTQIINECGRQLSSKEKIVVIGTEA